MGYVGGSTAIRRTGPSNAAKLLIPYLYGKVLDYGCGHGADVDFINQGVADAIGYDPVHLPNDEYKNSLYDCILCTYVLNVVTVSTERRILKHLKSMIKPGGRIFVTVRRDIKKEGQKGRRCWQRWVECPQGFITIHEDSRMAILSSNPH